MDKKVTGIYCFVNKENNRKYVGQSINILQRLKQHKYRYNIKKDSGYKSAFHSALRKYGWDNFSFYILEECLPQDLDRKEIHWIFKLNTVCPNGYNILKGGKNNSVDYQKYICPLCGRNKNPISQICQQCFTKIKSGEIKNDSFKMFSPILANKDINISLIEKILDSSFEQVAKELGYKSGNSLKQRLKSNNIPEHKKELYLYYEKITGYKHKNIVEKELRQIKRDEYYKKYSPKRVGLFSKDGELLVSYPSIREASRQTGINSGHISEFCSGKRSQAQRDTYWRIL